jgi:hypothetical protein
VSEVESAGSCFLSDGRAKIPLEGHILYKYTKGAWPSLPRRSAASRGRGSTTGEAEALDKTAARMSASYGGFQIMRLNFEACGFDSVDAFYEAMQWSEGEHLEAFVKFVRAEGLDGYLRD